MPDEFERLRIARDSFKDLAAENAIAADRYARENATLRAERDQLAADLCEAREERDRLREAHRASRYLSGLYRRCWLGRPVRDLGEAEAAYDTARAALTPDLHQAAGSASNGAETDASGS
ncbi:hypothetical protein [Methylobacterium pseudosasicola]|uniref:Uncharacterized protein n=1 Tax=Methylobacterium pseudosasicola TaxID=582667 RepID=A0A1I4V6Y3_9HYPH|nr:hypothetical protein [Methylobacterium pseudosasicola]SFM96952.1 hypothetical protein SAMN05192568_10895 [Methylobacterium pseudosasicola]